MGIGAGWWEREHAAYGLPFPSAPERLDELEYSIRLMRALWAPGTKAVAEHGVHLPETTCYPRPPAPVPVVVGGGGERRTLRIAAELGDACNIVSSDPDLLRHKVEVLRRHCAEVGRDPAEVAVTVLDLPVVGRDRDDVWARVERLRGRTRGRDVRRPAPTPGRSPTTGRATPGSPTSASRRSSSPRPTSPPRRTSWPWPG